jgi:hypothetical protein
MVVPPPLASRHAVTSVNYSAVRDGQHTIIASFQRTSVSQCIGWSDLSGAAALIGVNDPIVC